LLPVLDAASVRQADTYVLVDTTETNIWVNFGRPDG